MDNIVTYVDEYFLRAKTKMPFPSVVIESKDMEALALVMQALDTGEVSVIFPYENKFNVIKKKISNKKAISAVELELISGTFLFPFAIVVTVFY